MRRVLLVCGVLAALPVSACGEDDPRGPAGQPEEQQDRRGPLPSGWQRVINRRAGFSLGIPPGWSARGAAGATLVSSGDRLFAASISADRSLDGRRLSPAVYARRTLRNLRGYRGLRIGRARPAPGARYPGASVTAVGTFGRRRVRQAIEAVVLRRRGQATFALLFFRNTRGPAALYGPASRGMVRTFRAQAPVY